MSYLFASAPIDEEAIRLDVQQYCDESGLCLAKMRDIHNSHGVKHASMYIKESLKKCPVNNQFLEELENSPPIKTAHFEIIIIPSLFYQQHPEIGGDGNLFKLIAERLNIPYSIAPSKSLGSISSNAKILVDFLEKRDKSTPKWILSMSKGVADLKRALSLQLSPECRRTIHGIFNVSGAQGGSILAGNRKGARLNHFLMKNWLRLRGADSGILHEMHRDHHFSRSDFTLDNHIEAINIFGLPLLSHLRKPMINFYRELSKTGPNDGYVLTEDTIIPDSKNILFWGVDHFLRTPELNQRIEQSLRWINKREGER